MKFCNHCGKQLEDSVHFCPQCGIRCVQAGVPVQPTVPVQPDAPVQQPVQHIGADPKPVPKKKKGHGGVIALILILLLLLGGCVALVLHALNQSPDVPQEDPVVNLYPTAFRFRQTAFECGLEDVDTLVMAAFDESLDTTGLELYTVCDETGEKIVLTDDGKGADTVAGDNVFYGRASFAAEEEGKLTYVLKTDSDGYAVKADSAHVKFYTLDTLVNESYIMDMIESDMFEIFNQYYSSGDEDADAALHADLVEKMKAYLDQMCSDGDIESYVYSGTDFIIELPLQIYVFHTNVNEEVKAGGSYNESIMAEADYQMMLMLPYSGELGSNGFEDAMQTISDADIGYADAQMVNRSDVTVELLKSLHNYRVIAINTHGGNSYFDGSFFSIGTANSDISYEDRANRRLLRGSKGYALVSAAFFEYYYEDSALNDCLFYLGCCHGADDDVLALTLIRKGADAVLAFTNGVYSSYDAAMVQDLFYGLCRDSETGEAGSATIVEALAYAKDCNGAKDPYCRGKDTPAELKLYQANASDPFRLVKDADSGTISGKVVSASDGYSPIPYARVTIEGNGISKSFYTDANGAYTYSLPSGEYVVSVSADEYMPLNLYTSVYVNYTTYLETLLMISEEEQDQTGFASGYITSALTGQGLEGVMLTVRNGWNNLTDGDVILTTESDYSGYYSLELPVGNYTVYAELDGYVPMSFNVVVQTSYIGDQNGSMNLDIDGDQFRIVLSWGENPEDLDIHIVGPKADYGDFHVYYWDMTYYEDGIPVCQLDVDDRYSYGPETITLLAQHSGAYYCYIHHYTGSGKLSTSDAYVSVYSGSQLVANFSVPTTGGYNEYWNVFAIVDGQIYLKNTITAEPDTSYAD